MVRGHSPKEKRPQAPAEDFSPLKRGQSSCKTLVCVRWVNNSNGGEIVEIKSKFQGCYVATLTPFDSKDALDEGVVSAHADWLVENGAQGLCPAGTTGEFLYLTQEEKRRLVAATVKAVRGRVPVIAGVWALRMEEITALARAAEDAGADGIFLPTPIYYPAGDDAVFAFYSAVARATALPLFAYNIPQYTTNEISFACLDRLFEEGLIAGVKDSTGKADRVRELVARFGGNRVVFAASDGFATKGRRLGADGFISAIANVTPRLFSRLWAGNESFQAAVTELRGALKQFGSIPALKYLAGREGFVLGASRIPCSDFSSRQREQLDAIVLPNA